MERVVDLLIINYKNLSLLPEEIRNNISALKKINNDEYKFIENLITYNGNIKNDINEGNTILCYVISKKEQEKWKNHEEIKSNVISSCVIDSDDIFQIRQHNNSNYETSLLGNNLRKRNVDLLIIRYFNFIFLPEYVQKNISGIQKIDENNYRFIDNLTFYNGNIKADIKERNLTLCYVMREEDEELRKKYSRMIINSCLVDENDLLEINHVTTKKQLIYIYGEQKVKELIRNVDEEPMKIYIYPRKGRKCS